MENILHFPETTLYGVTVTKTAFYSNLDVRSKMKRRFIDDIDSIIWLYKIAPSVLNVVPGKDVTEITVFLVSLKTRDYSNEVFTFIDRNLPRHLLFVLQFHDEFRLLLNYKEWLDKTAGKFNIIKSFSSPWTSKEDLSLKIQGLSMDSVYDGFAGQISGYGTSSKSDTKQISELEDLIQQKTKSVEALQKKIDAERQFNRQVEMSTQSRLIEKEIKSLDDQINRIKNKNQ